MAPSRTTFLLDLLLLILLLIALSPLLGVGPVFQVSEGREGVVVNEILRSGEIILPLRHGEVVPSKPILFHWIGASFAHFAGTYNEFYLRLPSFLSALLATVSVFSLLCLTQTRRSAWIQFLVLWTTYGFTHLAIDGRVDMLFAGLFTAALTLWLFAAEKALAAGKSLNDLSAATYLGVALLCGLSVLAKGPLGIVLPLLIIASIAFFQAGISGLKSLLRKEWLLVPLIGAPWYLLAALSGKESFLDRQLIFENIARFFGGEGINQQPFWFYFLHVWGQTMPWGIFFVLILFLRWQTKKEPFLGLFKLSPEKNFLARSALIWFLIGFLFFSLAAGKRRAYLLPLLPGLSLYLGLLLDQLLIDAPEGGLLTPTRRLYIKRFFLGFYALALLLTLIFGIIAVIYSIVVPSLPECSDCNLFFQSLSLAVFDAPLLFACYILSFSALGLASLYRFHRSESSTALWVTSFSALLLGTFIFPVFFLTQKGMSHSYKDFALTVQRELSREPQSEPRIEFIKKRKDESFDGFFFYFGDRIYLRELDYVPRDPALYYLARRRWFDAQEASWKAQTTILKEGGRRTDDADEKLVLFRYSETP